MLQEVSSLKEFLSPPLSHHSQGRHSPRGSLGHRSFRQTSITWNRILYRELLHSPLPPHSFQVVGNKDPVHLPIPKLEAKAQVSLWVFEFDSSLFRRPEKLCILLMNLCHLKACLLHSCSLQNVLAPSATSTHRQLSLFLESLPSLERKIFLGRT
jgi:hypothetical protein